MDISVVIPLYNEAESLPELFSWIERVMKEHNYTYEVIFVNDGSTDNSWEVIEELKQRSPHIRGIKFRRNYGKSPALYCGFAEAQGDVVITMDADLQEVLRRLKTEERIGKFLKLILTDTNYESLCKALEEKNYEQAFTHIHNLKGLAMNLGLTPLLVPAQELCEELRDGEPERDLKPLLDEVAAAYQKVLGIVERLD